MSNKYESIYGATRKIGPHQFLAEYIIKRKSDSANTILPNRFWSIDDVQLLYWQGSLKRELNFASRLLKFFDVNIILHALNSNGGDTILSLNNKRLEPLCIELKRKYDAVKSVSSDTITENDVKELHNETRTGGLSNKKSKRSKLNE